MNIIGRRKIWYAISLLVIVPGAISLITNQLKLGIDFTGGSLIEIQNQSTSEVVKKVAIEKELKDVSVITSGDDRYLLRYRDDKTGNEAEQNRGALRDAAQQNGGKEIRFESVGPSVSRDITINALIAVIITAVVVALYIAIAFRNTPPPVKPIAFGVATILAVIHDVILLLGVFSLLGVFFGVEVDALFVTAVLTVIGFSVHDTIVVFDRIRENLRRERGSFEEIVNKSINETLARSLNTSLTVLLTLSALLLFGGDSIRLFVLALFIGIASGTYSSILNASPLLVSWQKYQAKKRA